MNSVRIVIPYFGKWPVWFPLFLESCRWNPTVSWLFFTDCPECGDSPPNVSFVSGTLKDFCVLASKKLNLPSLSIVDPYKVCDFKPLLGLIFEDYLEGFDFWGHGDVDVVYGNLRAKLTDELLRFDVISMHRRYISGHLTLYRNTTEVNELFKRVDGWSHLLAHPSNQKFDEVHFLRAFNLNYLNQDKHFRDWDGPPIGTSQGYFFHEAWSTPRFYLNNPFSLRRIRWRGNPKNKLWDGQTRIPDIWYWKDGRLWNNVDTTDRTYLHFMHWAREDWRCISSPIRYELSTLLENGFRLEKSGIYPIKSPGPGIETRITQFFRYQVLRVERRMLSILSRTKRKVWA